MSPRTSPDAAQWVHVSDLRPWIHNPRKNDHRVPDAVRSLRRFGFCAPIVAWRSAGRIVAGHARLKAVLAILKEDAAFTFQDAPAAGMVPVRFMEFANEDEANAYALRDNNPLGEWDDTLPFVLKELEAAGAELGGLGWSDAELHDLLAKAEGPVDEPASDESDKAKTGFAVLIECDDEDQQREVIEVAQEKELAVPRVDLKLEVDIEQTPRVVQLSGIFDLPEKKRGGVEFHFDVPLEARDWQIGLITGPSGAGKSTVARHLFGDAVVGAYPWEPARSVVDSFGDLPVRDVTAALSSVGFSSPPSWVKPFHVLSNGEQFRATMARAILDPRPLVVVDEFTSVVDRTVARIGAHAIGKAVRAKPGKQFVAVTCHDDVTDWLQPDWILEPHVGHFTWRCLQRRPEVELEIVRTNHAAWRWFAPHHYLTAELHPGAKCFAGLVEGRPAAFAGLIHFPHPKVRDIMSLSRLVVHPDFQGLGLGAYAFTETIGALCKTIGKRMSTHPSHPALVRTWAKSPRWKMTTPPGFTGLSGKSTMPELAKTHALRRRVAHFQYVGPALAAEHVELARRMWS